LSDDRVRLEGMIFYGFHGVEPAEREVGQRFSVDLEVGLDLRPAGLSDDVSDTVNYSRLYRAVREIAEGPSRNLLENLAEGIAERILNDFAVESVKVRVKKPEAPIRGSVLAYAGVEIFRSRSDPAG
jgi:dihydroneopterin aldolase